MNPKTIESNFVDRHNLDRRCNALLGSGLQPRKKVEQFAPSPPASVWFGIFLLPGVSAVATHVERLSSNETNKVAQSLRRQVSSGTGRVVA
jgi:hypothetical protein